MKWNCLIPLFAMLLCLRLGHAGEPAPVSAPAEPPAPASGEAASPAPDLTQLLILQALSLIGVDYRWGGNSPETGLDCSGFIRYVFQQALNIALPHNAFAISRLGQDVDRDELKPGDLVFFNTLGRRFSHVGIYLGDDRFIHSPSKGHQIQVVSLKEKYWIKHYNGARRITQASVAAGPNIARSLTQARAGKKPAAAKSKAKIKPRAKPAKRKAPAKTRAAAVPKRAGTGR